ncbi:MAG TPA: UvrD-helicase domain-containing protein [Conexibacter sp.]
MSDHPVLSPQQQRIFDPSVRVVEAGPGAGKTRVLVARFLHEAARSTRGVALLSFTNAAVDEVHARTASEPRLARAPHFVGTIDSFLHRFIVTPRVIGSLGRAPHYIRSWSDLPDHHRCRTVRVKDVPGAGVSLARFFPERNRIVLAESALGDSERKYVADVDAAGLRKRLLWIAEKRISDYTKAGVFDPTTARQVAARALRNDPSFLERLAQRFSLLLVDEAQDCDAFELAVFRTLGTRIPTVLAADPDQAIFGFRGGGSEHFVTYRDNHDGDARLDLSENHRSSPAICETVTALRAVGLAAIRSRDGADGPPVLVLSGSMEQVRGKFLAALEEHDVALSGAVCLAHRRRAAADLAGQPLPSGTAACGNRLAIICGVMSDPRTSIHERRRAIADAESIVLSLVCWPKAENKSATRRQQLELLGRDATWLRIVAASLVARASEPGDPAAFGAAARDFLRGSLDELPLKCSVTAKVKRPDATSWAQRNHVSSSDVLGFDTVHGFKGREQEAVLVSLFYLQRVDDKSVLDVWDEGLDTEARRVLYVAASRARSLLAFAATAQNAARVAGILRRHGVSVELR